ncbi:MAG: alkaline phosphatase family protein [Candidatus Pacearchaeota archaeon]|nr:alkaline phosphatase family protein [Candidatus Pacearchaeota archaeon]
MKGILVIIDGLGDLPNKQLDNKTPLESANTPNMNFFATRGELGFMYPVKPGFVPESDEALLSIFGNQPTKSSRGWLEATGANAKISRGDLIFRTNFATTDEEKNITDRRAGRNITTKEAKELSRALNKIELPCKFQFIPTVQHRGILIFKGGHSDNITGNDHTYTLGKIKLATTFTTAKALDDTENTLNTANIVNEFLTKSKGILQRHPVNKKRKEKGLLPANQLLIRGGGIEPPTLKQYKFWLAPNTMPLEIGFAKLSGMKTLSTDYPKLKKIDAYENLFQGLKKHCNHIIKILNKNLKKYDYTYIHIKETDLPGHDNKPLEKKEMIEYIDKALFKYLRKIIPQNKIKLIVTADHSTPCKQKIHTADPVPVLYYNETSLLKEKKFSEKEARIGLLGRIEGAELLQKAGFVKQ